MSLWSFIVPEVISLLSAAIPVTVGLLCMHLSAGEKKKKLSICFLSVPHKVPPSQHTHTLLQKSLPLRKKSVVPYRFCVPWWIQVLLDAPSNTG